MLIEENKIEKDGVEYIQIEFKHHKATVYVAEIPATFDRCPALRLAKAKAEVIEKFLKSPSGKKFTEKEVLKAYSKIDKHFQDIFKEKYPHGGYRNGGRPKGTKTSNRTERFQQSITPEEKEFLIKALEYYRACVNPRIEDLFPGEQKGGNKKVHKVSDEYINAVQEIQNEQEKSRPKLRTLDEAYKEYREKHK